MASYKVKTQQINDNSDFDLLAPYLDSQSALGYNLETFTMDRNLAVLILSKP